ncbi:MAG: (E)-4-hydroxy-3-methylbut-2-enyl-diphosphate synthase [Bacteroidales bacterium]|nr:(E)-4-hydroxy-3-methylbut-2-enyl-diphosphate synthase [Bacteroidales bacterium]
MGVRIVDSNFTPYITREVKIGEVVLGGNQPIRIQSMTNTPTLDTEATVSQCIRIIEAGGELVRITTPTSQDAENLKNIKAELRRRGYRTPLVADVHFNPDIAEIAAQIVEKVRINPGNYATRRNIIGDLSEKEYKEELEKIHNKLRKLLDICRRNGTAIRIGVNHGSLSPRIVNRYGDTPAGMVESAMEFVRMCAAENFHNLVISLKASNTRIMVQAYRLLVSTMKQEGFDYPLHLGVTEAGDGIDGRIRSAVGIATLLADGIGDTIRVSLTEDPEAEIPVAQKLAKFFPRNLSFSFPEIYQLKDPFNFEARNSLTINQIGSAFQPIVIADFDFSLTNTLKNAVEPDFYYLLNKNQLEHLSGDKLYIINLHDWFLYAKNFENVYPLYTAAEYDYYGPKHMLLNFVIFSAEDIRPALFETLQQHQQKTVIILESFSSSPAEQREVMAQLRKNSIKSPVIINRNYSFDNIEDIAIRASADTGLFFVDNVADGLWIRNAGAVKPNDIHNVSFTILQAARVRTTKTEYISCPSCGRTLFDLQSTTARIKEKTSHLRHLKIAIMGCIVNGPGEMADADYGYVGAGPDKVTLYKGKEIIKRNISSEKAVDELIQIIKDNGDWIDP